MTTAFDAIVVGGGLVGLATAHRLLAAHPRLRLALLEKERELALHQSRRNSGVLHSGIYYTPGSWRALLCREGKTDMERFAQEHGVPVRRLGKVIVAVHDEELERLDLLEQRGIANGLRGVRQIGPDELRDLEPDVVGTRALHVPETAIIDFRRVAAALAAKITALGGAIWLGQEVLSIRRRGSLRLVRTDRAELVGRLVISCAGLQSDRLAPRTTGPAALRIIPFRGSYFCRDPRATWVVRRLVYPVPDPALPFLGIHFTPRLDGGIWVGPNAVLALAREGYGRRELDVRDLADILAFGGFWRLALSRLGPGLGELLRDLSAKAMADSCRRYIPSVEEDDLRRGPSGIRAQAVRGDGSLVDDFVLQQTRGWIHVRNAPSPAATASFAIGRVLAGHAQSHLGL